MRINDFHIKINRENVFSALKCFENSSVYPYVFAEYEKQTDVFFGLIKPEAVIDTKEKSIYRVIITIGSEISDYSTELFDKGEGMAGLLINTMADEYIFEADKYISGIIREECAKAGKGVKQRKDDLTPEEMCKAASLTERVELSEAGQFVPAKTMAYILELTEDKEIFEAQHDCSKCERLDCPRRQRKIDTSKTHILSEYDGDCKRISKSVVSVDIGTTTVVFEYFKDGKRNGVYSAINQQRRFGADVLSRISAANCGRGADMKKLIDYTLIDGISKLCGNDEIEEIVIGANTVMTHLLMGYPCTELGKYPFKAHSLETVYTSFDTLTGSSGKKFPVVVTGGISAFVGGDIVNGIIFTQMAKKDSISLFIDLGTNGEMVIGNKNGLLCASTAAGPAFEGGRIQCGTASVEGAVCGVKLSGKTIKTIGNKPPVGICGTGITELISEMYTHNIIDGTGLLSEKYFEKGYKLCDNVVLMQSDIREVQMAKAAIRSGIDMLIEHYGADLDEIETVYLAGGFGRGLDVNHAAVLGIIPKRLKDKVVSVGNSSLGGCTKIALENRISEIEEIKGIAKELILGGDVSFGESYLKNMNFGV